MSRKFNMKKNIVFIFLFLTSGFANAQAPYSFYSNHGAYNLSAMTHDAIYFMNFNNVLDKINYEGRSIWSRTLPGYTNNLVVNEGYIYLTSGSLLIKMDTSGTVVWGRDISAHPCFIQFYIMGIATDGNHVYVATANPQLGVSYNNILTFDSNGTLVNSWCDMSGTDSFILKGFPRIKGGAWYSYKDVGTALSYTWIEKVDTLGNMDTNFNTIHLNFGIGNAILDIITMPDSSYLALTKSYSDLGWNPADFSIGLSRFKDDGTVLWQRKIRSASAALHVFSGGIDSTGNIYLLGYNDYNGPITYFIMKLDTVGNIIQSYDSVNLPQSLSLNYFSPIQWHQGDLYCPLNIFGSAGVLTIDTNLTVACGVQMAQNNYLMTIPPVDTFSIGQSAPSVYAQVDTFPAVSSHSLPSTNDLCLVLSLARNIPEDIEAAPNPCGDWLTVKGPTQIGEVEIELFDLLGTSNLKVHVQSLPVTLNTADFKPGIYIVRVKNKSMAFVRKVVIG